MNALLWMLGAYLCGSIPFSVWLGRLVLRKEIRNYGDGNPGGTNVFRAGGRGLGLTVILLDGLKGLLPLLLAQSPAQLSGLTLAAIALAAVMGHAFSILQGFRGGKAVAVSCGIWVGLSGWPTLFVLGALLLEGYAKNTLTGFGNGAGLIAGTVFHWLVFLSPWVLFGLGLARTGVPDHPWWALALIAIGVFLRGHTAWRSGQRVGDALLLPVSVLLMTCVAIQAMWWRMRYGGPKWKGRVAIP